MAVLAFNASNPVGWIALGITGLIVFRKQIGDFINKLKEIGDAVKTFIFDRIFELYNKLPDFLKKIISGSAKKIKIVVERGQEVAGNVIDTVTEGASNILGGK